MIHFYYSPDPGLLEQQKKDFLKICKAKNVLTINFKSYPELFSFLTQGNLFDAVDCYVIDDFFGLAKIYNSGEEKNLTKKENENNLKEFLKIVLKLQTQGCSFFISCHSAELFKSDVTDEILSSINNKNSKILPLNVKTKKEYINYKISALKLNFSSYEVEQYLYEFLSKKASIINDFFDKVELLNTKTISFKEIYALVEDNREFDFFKLVDEFLTFNSKKWLIIYNTRCLNIDDLNALINTFIYKTAEFYNYLQLKMQNVSIFEISKILNKQEFMLKRYEEVYNKNSKQILSNIHNFILKLYKYVVTSRKRNFLSVNSFKFFLLENYSL